MRVINARNVNDAWPQALDLLLNPSATVSPSRAGRVRVWPEPVTTVYARPMERVLMDPHRDANVFFHLFEGLWMIAGRNDATWLDQFIGDFSARFGEEDGTEHDAYGHRWRHRFGFDQLDVCVDKLRRDSGDRQAVIQMWDSTAWPRVKPKNDIDRAVTEAAKRADEELSFLKSVVEKRRTGKEPSHASDLTGEWKTRPCNTHAYLRVQETMHSTTPTRGVSMASVTTYNKTLDMTVLCRSNDACWGAYGANCVHFSMLLEYLAARIGVGVGRMYQVSNNLHLYDASADHVDLCTAEAWADRPYPGTTPMVTEPEAFDDDLRLFMDHTEPRYRKALVGGLGFKNRWFGTVATPMFMSNVCRRERDYPRALDWARQIAAPDWRAAAVAWIERRIAKRRAV